MFWWLRRLHIIVSNDFNRFKSCSVNLIPTGLNNYICHGAPPVTYSIRCCKRFTIFNKTSICPDVNGQMIIWYLPRKTLCDWYSYARKHVVRLDLVRLTTYLFCVVFGHCSNDFINFISFTSCRKGEQSVIHEFQVKSSVCQQTWHFFNDIRCSHETPPFFYELHF